MECHYTYAHTLVAVALSVCERSQVKGRAVFEVVIFCFVISNGKVLPLLLLHEEIYHEDLLLVNLNADVLRDVRNDPVHNVTHQHHHILHM